MHDLVYGIGHYCSLENAKTFGGSRRNNLGLWQKAFLSQGQLAVLCYNQFPWPSNWQ